MSRHPFTIIGGTVGLLIITLSYLLRIAEGPAYTPHSFYFWEQVRRAPAFPSHAL